MYRLYACFHGPVSSSQKGALHRCIIPILKIYDLQGRYFHDYLHANQTYSCLGRLSIIIFLYKDDVIFIALFIVYFLAVYHAMVNPLAL